MSLLNNLWLGIRATVFWAGAVIFAIVHGLLVVVYWLLPYKVRYEFIMTWNRFCIWWLKVTCGVNYKFEGLDNLKKDQAHIILANHQSTWETMALGTFPINLTWVLKRELMKIPVFGWGAALLKPIPIDRAAGRSAVDQIVKHGKMRLDEGIYICLFPEGTRVKPGQKKRYKLGGAILASETQYPVIPVAHNAGYFWPKHSYIKKPGTITVCVGEPISTEGKSPEEINKEVQNWIEAKREEIIPTDI